MKDYERIGLSLRIFFLILVWINESLADMPRDKPSDNMIKMKAVKDKILNGYDKAIRPMLGQSNTTEVNTGLMPRQIIEVDEEKGLFTLDSYLFMSWHDPRLIWDLAEYKEYLQLSPDFLWLPDIAVYNSHSLQVNPMQKMLALIMYTGLVMWVPPVLTQTSCPELKEKTYPYDVVTCIVRLGSWAHDGWEIDFSHSENIYMEEFVNINARWELMASDVQLIRNVTYFEGYDEPYISLNAMFPIRRRTLPEIEATQTPCILIMLLTLSIFWLPPNSSKKIILGGMLLLSLTVLLVYVAVSTRFPLAVISAVSFLQSTMIIVVTSLLFEVLVIFNLCNITGPVRPPPAAMQLLTGPFGKYACLRSSTNDNVPIDRIQLKEDSPNCIESPTPRDDWMLFAAGLDRLFFVLMSIAMIAIHHL